MAEALKVPSMEVLKRRGRRALAGIVLGLINTKAKGYLPTVKEVHKFARDTLGRPDYAGHMVVVPLELGAALVLSDKYEEEAKALANVAGYELGEIIGREISGEPIIKLYTDKISLERFDANAEIKLVIDGELYDASKFTSPAKYGTIDTSTNKIYTDGDGKFEASFASALPEGEHTVCVSTGSKGKCIRVEI